MKVTIRWRCYPKCPKATEYDRARSYLLYAISTIVSIALFILLIGFFVCMGAYLTNADWGQFFGGVFCLLGGGALAHMTFVWYPHCTEKGIKLILLKHDLNSGEAYKIEKKRIKKDYVDELREATKMYYFWYLSVVVFILVVCVFIFSIVCLVTNQGGFGWLLFSICAGVGSVVGFIRLKDIVEGFAPFKTKAVISKKSPSLLRESSNTKSNNDSELYCHKCGRKLKSIQLFCQSCGTPVIKDTD